MPVVDVSKPSSGGGGSGGGGGGSGNVALNLQGLSGDYTITAADDGKWFHNIPANGIVTLYLPSNPTVGFVVGAISAVSSGTSTMAFMTQGSDRLQTPVSFVTPGTRLGCTNSGRPYGCALQVTYLGSNLWNWCGGYPYDWTGQ